MSRKNDPCEVCGGSQCPEEWHVEVFACPVCGEDYDEFSPQFKQIVNHLFQEFGDRAAKRVARYELADWLENQAEEASRSSRDFGRGFMYAVRLLREGHDRDFTTTSRDGSGARTGVPATSPGADRGRPFGPGDDAKDHGPHAHGPGR